MTNGLNRVMLFGNLGTEPELKTTANGLAVLSMRLATNEVYFDKDQNRQERTEWHNVVMFGARATALSRMLSKGSRVLVEGRLQTSSYEKDGVKRYKTDVIASDLCFGQSRAGGSPTRPPSAPAVLEDVPF
ncbi:MAG TPA: single-stranded DNA-binding protein [Polyangiaceae bacterium]|nr:single-stranded DNA-binding protein [Polyangiaceae bacterium]